MKKIIEVKYLNEETSEIIELSYEYNVNDIIEDIRKNGLPGWLVRFEDLIKSVLETDLDENEIIYSYLYDEREDYLLSEKDINNIYFDIVEKLL